MTQSNTNSSTFTFSRIDVVVMQFKVVFEYFGVLTENQEDKVCNAIRNKKISAMGFYAYDKKTNERISEVEIDVEWDKHETIVKQSGERFNYTGAGFNKKTDVAAETKIYVEELCKFAKGKGYGLSCWVRLNKKLPDAEKNRIFEEIGFTGGRPKPWRGNIKYEVKERYASIEDWCQVKHIER